MRTLAAAAFVSLDGVMQGVGGPHEDPSGDFPFGGWVVPYADDTIGKGTAENGDRPFDLVLGRRTYELWAGHWPHVQLDCDEPRGRMVMEIKHAFDAATKHVAARTAPALPWGRAAWLGPDAVAGVRALKDGEGPLLLVQGSSDFVQSLLAADLVDELRLLTYPVVLGTGKRLFGRGTRPGAFRLVTSRTSATGVVLATYVRDGAVRTGSFVPGEAPGAGDAGRTSP